MPESEYVDDICGMTKTKACRDVNTDDLKDLKPPYQTSIDFGMPNSEDAMQEGG